MWVEAILNYTAVAKKVKPKKAAVEQAQRQQNQNQKDLENIVEKTKDLMLQVPLTSCLAFLKNIDRRS